MSIQGNGLKSTNPRLRLLIIVFLGVMALGTVIYWQQQLFVNSDYVYLNNEPKIDTRPKSGLLRSQNFQVEAQEVSPAVEK